MKEQLRKPHGIPQCQLAVLALQGHCQLLVHICTSETSVTQDTPLGVSEVSKWGQKVQEKLENAETQRVFLWHRVAGRSCI